jgi:hypothetical protein
VIKEHAVYFARTIQIRPGAIDDYLRFSAQALLPVWLELHAEHVVESIDTIRLTRPLHVDEGIPEWHVLQVGRVPTGVNAEQFFSQELEVRTQHPGAEPGIEDDFATVMRCETLRTTPDSHLPSPREDLAGRRSEVRLSVEVINVTPTPAALDEYQHLMMINAGPANRKMRDEGIIYNFTPLETERVLSVAQGMPAWNQLHVMGMVPENMNEHVAFFDAALRHVNPASGGFDGYFGVLDGIRHRPQWSLGRWVDDLSVPRPT